MRPKFSIFSIATNEYIEYWKNMVDSISQHSNDFENVQFIVFTNKTEKIEEYKKEKKYLNIVIFETRHLPWPLITLTRYHLIELILEKVKSERFIYIDADMLIKSDFLKKIDKLELQNKIYFVPHPGYVYNLLETRKIKKIFNHIFIFLGIKKVGAWDRNKKSRAYVRKSRQKIYLCGGIWFGDIKRIKNFVDDLVKDTELDLKANLIPTWHDESYLNSWASKNSYELADPGFCFDHRFLAKYNIEPIVQAVNKQEMKP